MATAITIAATPDAESPEQRSLWRHALRRLLRNRLAFAGLLVVLALAVVALFAGQIAPHDPNVQDCATGALRGPSGDHLLGTDATCRDVLSRLIHGARVSLSVGILSQLAVFLIAVPIGALAWHYPVASVAAGAVVACVVIARHRDNIARLFAGTERRLGQHASA